MAAKKNVRASIEEISFLDGVVYGRYCGLAAYTSAGSDAIRLLRIRLCKKRRLVSTSGNSNEVNVIMQHPPLLKNEQPTSCRYRGVRTRADLGGAGGEMATNFYRIVTPGFWPPRWRPPVKNSVYALS